MQNANYAERRSLRGCAESASVSYLERALASKYANNL